MKITCDYHRITCDVTLKLSFLRELFLCYFLISSPFLCDFKISLSHQPLFYRLRFVLIQCLHRILGQIFKLFPRYNLKRDTITGLNKIVSEALRWAEEEEKWFVYLKRNYLQSTSALNVANTQSMLRDSPVVNVLECDVGIVD